ncbi:MAG: hypothetical protein N4A65_10135 [Cohaesibacter sp.]|nr:hypothetical protein [Cohaesibacter sp.]
MAVPSCLQTFKSLVIVASIASLVACTGGGVPTPPGTISSSDQSPPSIMASLPADGSQPADNQPLANAPAQQQPNNQGLPPASSLGSVNQASTPAQQPATQQPAQSRLVASYKPPASKSVLTFEPMVGAPTNVARELSGSLGQRVAQQALPVVTRSDKSVTHRVKGYFSASESGGNCVVSYVWDIFDKSGKRINRITGTQQTPMVGSDPWEAVTGPILDKVAIDTAAQLKTWHASL